MPATQLDVIQKYADSDAAKAPKLNRLGTQEWNRTKTRVRTAVRAIAEDLVKLYAERERKEGFTYSEDTVWQREFEEMFPFDETDDQMTAIEAVQKGYAEPEDHGPPRSAVMWATARQRSRSVQPLRQYRTASRWPIWCRRQFWRSSITIHLCSE